ncbi:hypothetical protein [Arthrobacter sp. H35-D1]|uniref:hypothetical protein n=1 Tax=Arthrobacter sp. H35-D1 TaxID=3046202 RepID=UPI0024BA66C7|nr:hypothetical protein [Arthrobacter sp. H35-D1]MDJ0313701.1 hypothetical protein [Arthrobacter sp. H35-D1]
MSTVLARIRWYGEDSDRFRRDWNTVLRRTLQTVAAELDTVAKLLALNADDAKSFLDGMADSGGLEDGGQGRATQRLWPVPGTSTDIGPQHHAFQQGGLAEIERLQRAGLVTENVDEVWSRIEGCPLWFSTQNNASPSARVATLSGPHGEPCGGLFDDL